MQDSSFLLGQEWALGQEGKQLHKECPAPVADLGGGGGGGGGGGLGESEPPLSSGNIYINSYCRLALPILYFFAKKKIQYAHARKRTQTPPSQRV